MRSGIFTSVNGDRKYTSSFFAEYFASFIGNGVFPNPSTGMQVMAHDGLKLKVKPGKAWIDGYILFNDSDTPLTVEKGDNLSPRIDKVVARWDKIDREIIVGIKRGVPASKPVVPETQRDEDMHELGLATIYVAKGSTFIAQKDITDLRLNTKECGIVKGTVEEMDTTTLFNQYQDWINNKKTQFDADLIDYTSTKKNEWDSWFNITSNQLESDFNTWFQGIKDILDGDAVGNILNKIDAIPLVLSGKTEPPNLRIGDIWLKEVD